MKPSDYFKKLRKEEAIKLYDEGATYVIMPHLLGDSHASMIIRKHGFNIDNFLRKEKNISNI